jgi:hypothetical protein
MVANAASTAAGISAEFPTDARKWFFDQVNHILSTNIGDYTNIIGTFGAPRPNQYLKVGVENMMREESKHRWRIEYCDTGKQEPDVYDAAYNGDRPAGIIAVEETRYGTDGGLGVEGTWKN